MLRRVLLIAGAVIGVLLVFVTFGFARFLASFGMSLRQVVEVAREVHADAPAIRNAEGPIDTGDGIAERGFVKIGGIEQWVTIRGDDQRNPAILILHGGLGDAQSQLAYLYRSWEKSFTIVQWDQRGAGRTYGRYGNATPDMTLERMIEDGAEVAEYARKRLNQRKLILLGHSWGSALGIYLLKRHPDLFCAYVGTGQVVSASGLLAAEYAYTLSRLTADRENSAVAELRKLGPPPYRTDAQEEVMRKWLNRYLAEGDKRYLISSIAIMLGNSRYSLRDFRELQTGHLSFSLPKMYLTWAGMNVEPLGYEMPVPFFIVDGREDRITPPQFAADYLEKIQAPRKAMFLIDGGHFAMMSNPSEFLRIVTPELATNCEAEP